MWQKLKLYVETHFNTLIILSFVVGMLSPWAVHVPNVVILAVVGGLMYFSCARITMDELRQIEPLKALSFYVLRFLLLPFLLFMLTAWMIPQYKEAVLLLALIPAAAGSGAFAVLFGGNVAAALSYTVISSFLAPFVIPAAFAYVGYGDIDIDIAGMFYTLCAVVFMPIVLYFFLARPIHVVKAWTRDYAGFSTVVLLFVLLVLVVGKQRDEMISNPVFLMEAIPFFFLLFLVFYIFGWLFPASGKRELKISHAICSGAINNGLAIALALVYFSSEMTLMMVSSEIPWIFSIVLFKIFLHKKSASIT